MIWIVALILYTGLVAWASSALTIRVFYSIMHKWNIVLSAHEFKGIIVNKEDNNE